MQSVFLEQGFDLMLYGMGSVFVFLTVLVISTVAMSAVMTRFFPEPEAPLAQNTKRAAAQQVPANHMAAIKAALAQHRKG